MIRRPPRSTRMTHSFPTRRSSDLSSCRGASAAFPNAQIRHHRIMIRRQFAAILVGQRRMAQHRHIVADEDMVDRARVHPRDVEAGEGAERAIVRRAAGRAAVAERALRSEEHTSELQSLMRNSSAVFCLKTKN